MEGFTDPDDREQLPMILVMDSSVNHTTGQRIGAAVAKYIYYECLHHKIFPEGIHPTEQQFVSTILETVVCTVPQQLNNCDCGLYVLRFIDLVMTGFYVDKSLKFNIQSFVHKFADDFRYDRRRFAQDVLADRVMLLKDMMT